MHVSEVKVILWSLSKVTQNETGSQVSDKPPLVLWFEFVAFQVPTFNFVLNEAGH